MAHAADGVETFPLSPFQGDVPTVPVSLDGAEHHFMLDSGASLHGFDRDLRPALGDPVATESTVIQNDGTDVVVGQFRPPAATVGRFTLGVDAPVLCADLSLLREASGRNIKGILGMPFFVAHIVQFDFESNEISILPGDAASQKSWGESVAVFGTESNLPVVLARVAGSNEDEPFVVDTDFNGSISLRAELFDYLVEQGAISQPTSIDTALVNKIAKRSTGRLSALEIGSHEQKDLNVSRGGEMSRIGLSYLRRYLATLDFGRTRLFLKPNSHFPLPDLKPLLGMSMLRKGEKTMIIFVDENMLAASAGLQVGDELLSIGGAPITNQSRGEMQALFRSEVNQTGDLPLLVERHGKTRSILVRNLGPAAVPAVEPAVKP